MASNKVNAKAKGKDDKGKGSKTIIPINNEAAETDFSLLRKPIQTSITGFAQARKIFDLATEELKSLLSDECDLLYECKVCRNLFRSLANFISHKRVYCKDKFNTTVHGHFIKTASTLVELKKIKHIEDGYQESLKDPIETDAMDTDEVDERIPLTKDLTTIIEKIAKNKGLSEYSNDEPQVTLQKIPNTAVAVFQNLETGDEDDNEQMRSQVSELDNILSRNVAVLQNNGNFKIKRFVPEQDTDTHTESVIQISDDEESGSRDHLKCKICDMQFSTQKTLRFHMKYKHVDTRVVYPCPDCLEIFSTSWSVYRHLFKLHRKTAAQIRRMRESIQSKAFKMNNPPASYEKRKNNLKAQAVPKITDEERLEQENQAWMDNMETDSSPPRCGGCGRTFERRAALAAHTHTCQPRSRALARRPETKRIEIQIRKDYNKGPATVIVPVKPTDSNENKTSKEIKEAEKPKVQADKEPEPPEVPERQSKVVEEVAAASVSEPNGDDRSSKSPSESPEKVDQASVKSQAQAAKPIRLPFAQHAEKSNLMALRQRIIPDIELEHLRCKKCSTRCGHIQELYDHVAKHYNWMRYACKLCNFKHYNFEKLPEHVKVVHKLKGDKDFYFSTVKAIDGTEAVELATPVEEPSEVEETSSDSRRPSRCSSDSSRLSDDSSSSSTRVEGSRKRKMTQKGPSKVIGKRRKSLKGTKGENDESPEKDDSTSNVKAFEENSSDMDDAYEKIGKKTVEVKSSVASRRPVRRKTKLKNEDFEYDLSNLLKMEAQGYRDSQTGSSTNKTNQTKKKNQQESLSNYEMINKECCGALVSLSRKSVENAKAHMKTAAILYVQKEKVPSTIFVRPMIPKALTRGDKLSPKKEIVEDKPVSSSPNKETPKDDTIIPLEKDATEIATSNSIKDEITGEELSDSNDKIFTTTTTTTTTTPCTNTSEKSTEQIVASNMSATSIENNKDLADSNLSINEKNKPKSINIPAIVPLKFRRQSLDVIKNPIINKNITEFTKAGMKTKILVIKPMNRNKDGLQKANTSLKFQTIKLKETSKSCSSEDKPSDQVVLVKVPKVDCITRTVPDTTVTKGPCEKVSVIKRADKRSPTKEETQPNTNSLLEILNSEKNGDIKREKSESMEFESTRSLDEIVNKSNEINSTSIMNSDSITEKAGDDDVDETMNDISITSEETANLCKNKSLNVDDSSEMADH